MIPLLVDTWPDFALFRVVRPHVIAVSHRGSSLCLDAWRHTGIIWSRQPLFVCVTSYWDHLTQTTSGLDYVPSPFLRESWAPVLTQWCPSISWKAFWVSISQSIKNQAYYILPYLAISRHKICPISSKKLPLRLFFAFLENHKSSVTMMPGHGIGCLHRPTDHLIMLDKIFWIVKHIGNYNYAF